MKIANSFGWELLCPMSFRATWDGGRSRRSIVIETDDAVVDCEFVESKFGHGVLSFWPGVMLRTEEPLALFVTGPINTGKDGIHALSAVVESSWLPAQLPMNWRFTRADIPVRFEMNEPFCHFFPVDPGHIALADPAWKDLSEEPDLLQQFEEWRMNRLFANLDSTSLKCPSVFYRYYHQGSTPNGKQIPVAHYPSLRPKPFGAMNALRHTIVPREHYIKMWSVLQARGCTGPDDHSQTQPTPGDAKPDSE